MGHITVVSSQKKDIGKTIIAIKTAMELSKKLRKVLLVDLSFGSKKISEYLNVNEDIIYDAKDVLDQTCSMEQGLLSINENINLLPFPRMSNKLGDLKKRSINILLERAKEKYDFIIIDLDYENLFTCIDNINSLIIVNNNEFSSVNNINSMVNIANEFNISNNFVVLNKFNKKEANKGNMIKLTDFKKIIQSDLAGVIEYEKIFENLNYENLIDDQNNSLNNTIKNIVFKIDIAAKI